MNEGHAQKVELSMLTIANWLIGGKYRSIQHRHDGTYRAVDESSGDTWTAESLVELVELMRQH